MSYQEVSIDALSLNLSRPKVNLIEELVSAIRSSHAEIHAWIAATQQVFPVVQDRGEPQRRAAGGPRPSCGKRPRGPTNRAQAALHRFDQCGNFAARSGAGAAHQRRAPAPPSCRRRSAPAYRTTHPQDAGVFLGNLPLTAVPDAASSLPAHDQHVGISAGAPAGP